jgi:hypothetical protein
MITEVDRGVVNDLGLLIGTQLLVTAVRRYEAFAQVGPPFADGGEYQRVGAREKPRTKRAAKTARTEKLERDLTGNCGSRNRPP